MLVKHITEFMQQQLLPNKSHKIYVVKSSQSVFENRREVRYYDIREASLLEKAKFNLPTESSLRARAHANIELAVALEEMRKQEIVALKLGEVSYTSNFTTMGDQRLTTAHFANMTVDPVERATKLTGFDLSTMSADQWLRFKKIEKFLSFVQQERHIPGNLNDNASIAGSTASARQNLEDAIRTGESWRLFVIRNDEQHRVTERETYRNTSINLKDDLTIDSVIKHIPDAGGALDLAEEQRLERLVPDDATRRGRSNHVSAADMIAAQMTRKRAVLELEEAIVKKKELQAFGKLLDEVVTQELYAADSEESLKKRPPAPLPKPTAGEKTPPVPEKKGSPSRAPMPLPPQNGCRIPDISQTVDPQFAKNEDGTYKARVSPTRVDHRPTVIDASSWNIPKLKDANIVKLKDSDENLTSFKIDEKRQSPQSTAPTAVKTGDIPHSIIDHVNAPIVDDGQPIVYTTVMGAKPEPTRPSLPQELRVEEQQVDYTQTIIIEAGKGTFKVVDSDYAEIGKASPTRVVVAPVEKKVEDKPDPAAIYAVIDKTKVFPDDEAPPVPESSDKKLTLKPAIAPKPVKPARTGDASPEKVAETTVELPPVPARKSPPPSPVRVQSLEPKS